MLLPHTQHVLNWTYYLFSQVNSLCNFLMLINDYVFRPWLQSLHSCFSWFLLTSTTLHLTLHFIWLNFVILFNVSLCYSTTYINSLYFSADSIGKLSHPSSVYRLQISLNGIIPFSQFCLLCVRKDSGLHYTLGYTHLSPLVDKTYTQLTKLSFSGESCYLSSRQPYPTPHFVYLWCSSFFPCIDVEVFGLLLPRKLTYQVSKNFPLLDI